MNVPMTLKLFMFRFPFEINETVESNRRRELAWRPMRHSFEVLFNRDCRVHARASILCRPMRNNSRVIEPPRSGERNKEPGKARSNRMQ